MLPIAAENLWVKYVLQRTKHTAVRTVLVYIHMLQYRICIVHCTLCPQQYPRDFMTGSISCSKISDSCCKRETVSCCHSRYDNSNYQRAKYESIHAFFLSLLVMKNILTGIQAKVTALKRWQLSAVFKDQRSKEIQNQMQGGLTLVQYLYTLEVFLL